MTHLLVAEFRTAEAMTRAAGLAAESGCRAQDALSPFPVPEVKDHLSPRRKRPVGGVMVLAGAGAAGATWFMQWYSAVADYPIISGGRPLDSWQIFFLVSYEACILAAAIAGFIAFAVDCGLPALHHPLFEVRAIERATQDRFFLVFEASEDARDAVSRIIVRLKPVSTSEVAL